VDRWDDGEAERRWKLELTGVVVRSFRCTRVKLGRLGSTSGSRGALGALDRGWEAAWAAVDGEQKLRRRSGEARWSGMKRAVKMWVRGRKRKCIGSSRMCFKLKRGHSER
jgi:hypothetical protein